jgi:murein L,D-transpeptidase YcbB/YkuD
MLRVKGCALAAKRERSRKRLRAFVCAAGFTIAAITLEGCADFDDFFNDDQLAPPPSEFAPRPAPRPQTGRMPFNPPVAASPTQLALREIVVARKANLKGAAGSDAVAAFYEARDFRPAWIGGDAQQAMIVQIRAVIARANEQGLRPDDYRLPRDAQPAPGRASAQYDAAVTDALLRYAHDVRAGRFRPSDVYEDAALAAPRYDAAAELTRALRANAFSRYLTDLPPSRPEYRRLAAALARYRAIADEDGWPMIPGQGGINMGGRDDRVRALTRRLQTEDPKLAAISAPSATELRDALKRFQSRNGLQDDGVVGSATLAALNIPADVRAGVIAANMERWRWLPPQFERRYVAVNVPDQSAAYVRDGRSVLASKVVIGRESSPTPIVRAEIVSVVVNPPWNIPGDIAARDLLPQLKRNPNYLAANHMVVTDGPPNDPYGRKIDWSKIKPAEFPYAIRQLPGPDTVLGAVMLDSPNDFDVYLHDTPNKKLFDLTTREISNGCVRVQQIFPFASLALTGNPDDGMEALNAAVKTRETQRIALPAPLPVYFLYFTASATGDGEVAFGPDRYGRDAPLMAALKGEPLVRVKKRVDEGETRTPQADSVTP